MKPLRQKFATLSAILIIALSSLQPASACTTNNHVRPADSAADMVQKLMEEKNYKKLDELYAKYLNEKTQTPDRISALSTFFQGISQSLASCDKSKGSDEEWRAHKSSLLAWTKSSPGSTAAKLALAHHAIDEAWRARGNGYASTTDDAALKLFRTHMDSASRQFEALEQAGKSNPAWYAGMMQVGVGLGWRHEKVDVLYEKAVKVDPYYINVHFTYANFYSPKWYGSDDQLHKTIDRSAELTKQRLGQTMYARLHSSQSEASDMFTTGRVSWERMKTGFDDYLDIFSDAKTRSNYAHFACMAKDAKLLKQQLTLLGEHASPDMFTNQRSHAYCTALAANSETGKKPECIKLTRTGEIICR